MTEAEQQGAAFWEGIDLKCVSKPYSIMFQVEDNYPIYMHDYREWVEYMAESFPSNTTSYFVTEGFKSMNITLAILKFFRLHNYYIDLMNDEADWLEHNGVTTA